MPAIDIASALIPPPVAANSAQAVSGAANASAAGAPFGQILNRVLANGQGGQSGGQSNGLGGSVLGGGKTKGFLTRLGAIKDTAPDASASANGSTGATALAGLQGVMPGFLALPAQTAGAGLPNDLAKAVQDAVKNGAGGDPAALQSHVAQLQQRLDKAEAHLTGVDPKAAPEGWTEPTAFADARKALIGLLGATDPNAPATPTVADAKAAATAQALAAQAGPQNQAEANPVATAAAAQAAAPASAATAVQIADTAAATPLASKALTDPTLSGQALGSQPLTDQGPSAKDLALRADRASDKTTPEPLGAVKTGAGTAAKAAPPPAGDTGAQAIAQGSSGEDAAKAAGDRQASADSDTARAAADKALDPAPATTQAVSPAQVAYAQSADVNAAAAQAAVRGSPEATAFLAAQIVKRMDGQSTKFDMQLHPADLGRVDVQMRIEQDGRLNAQMAFDNPVAAADFRAQADTLRRQLEQAGFTLSDNSLTFTDRNSQNLGQGAGQGSGGFGQQAQDFNQNPGSAWGRTVGALASAATDTLLAGANPAISLSRTLLGLDMKV
jgi:flagellar hook-length control protein FliK